MMMSVELPYPAVTGNHAVRHTRSGGHYRAAHAVDYDGLVVETLRGRKAPAGLIHTDWLLAPPDRRARDADNVMKVVKDALTRAGFWVDDSNKVIGGGGWTWAPAFRGGAITLTVTGVKHV